MGLFKNKVAPEQVATDTQDDGKLQNAAKDNKSKHVTTNAAKDDSNKRQSNEPAPKPEKSNLARTSDSSSTASVGSAGSKAAKLQQKREKLSKKKAPSNATKALITAWRRFSCMFLSPVFLRHRNKIYILIEVLLPALVSFAIFTAFTSGISWKKAYSEKQESDKSGKPHFPDLSMDAAIRLFREKYEDGSGRVLILFTPVTNVTISVMSHALELLHIDEKNKIDVTGHRGSGAVGVSSPLELFEKALFHRNETLMHLKPVGISFIYDHKDDAIDNITGMPYHMSFAIRTFDDEISETNDDFPYIKPAKDPFCTVIFNNVVVSPYVASGFIGLQYSIEQSYLRNLIKKVAPGMIFGKNIIDDLFETRSSVISQKLLSIAEAPKVYLKMFYYPSFYDDTIRTLISFTVCCCLVTAYLFTSYFIVRQIVQENKSGIKDLLKMHGMPVYLHWVILFFHALFFRGLTAIFMTLILYSKFGHGQILSASDETLIFVILWAHLMTLTFFNFFLATMVHSVSLVGLYSTLIGLLSFIIPVTFNKMDLIEEFSNIALVAMFPNWALYNVFSNIVDFECDDKGVTWNNFYKLSHGGGKMLRISTTLMLMCGSAIIYLFFAIYRDLTSQVKLFPPSYRWWDIWGRSKQKLVNKAHHKELVKDIQEGRGQDFDKPAIYEEPEAGKKCFVRIRHLCKRYGKHKMALDTLNLNILHEEITVLLGHSGCGKSTLISILAGMISPTTGYATIKDFDVSFEARKARHFTGLCTQKLIYFNLLTVKQHVFMCYRLRGYDKEECNRHTATLLTRLRLWNVRNFFPDSLTNDELRRLGISMAMADAPKVLLLDEPTGGMDAFGRREIWTILKTLRQHHTIILTSNYMDEAEYLADRIALIAHGRLVCFGSVDFLKSQYDTGYFLKIEPLIAPNIVKLDPQTVLNLIRNRVGHHAREKKHKLKLDVDNLIIELPRKQLSKFPELCDDLDNQLLKLGIKKYSIREVCLSDIFIKICESIASEKDAPDLYVRRDSAGDLKSALTSQIPSLPEADRYQPKVHHQIFALLLKRWTSMRTRNDFVIWEYIVPLCLILLVVWEAKIFVTPLFLGRLRNLTYHEYENDIQVMYKIGHDDMAINYAALIKTILGKYGVPLLKKDQVERKLLDLLDQITGNTSKGDARESHMTALELRKSSSGNDRSLELVGYFASGSLHSAPIILNKINNILIRAVTGLDSTEPHYSLYVLNEPLPLKIQSPFVEKCSLVCIIFGTLLAFAYGFISSSTVSFPMRERRNGMKHLQLMTGVHPAIYWTADYICDAINMLIMTVFIALIFFFNPLNTFKTMEVVFVLMAFTALYFAWSGLAFSYFMSTLIPLKFNGFNFMIVFHVLIAILPFIWLELAFEKSTSAVVVFFRIVMLIFPGFAVTCAIHDWFEVMSRRSICKAVLPSIQKMCSLDSNSHEHQEHPGHMGTQNELYKFIMDNDFQLGQCCDRICKPVDRCFQQPHVLSFDDETLAHPKLITDLFALVFTGVFYWVLLIVAEKKVFGQIAQRVVLKFLETKKKPGPLTAGVPKDIKHENLVVKSILNEEDFPADVVFVVQDLTKSHTATMVINALNLEVKKGECIGILGAGGSGKTAIMKMMSGAVIPTKGMCYIRNGSLIHHRKQYLSSIGYCPQDNMLFDNFTGIQMLELMGKLRGVPSSLLSSHVAKWLLVMGLTDAGKDRCKTYGPGMRRRICCAMALIGNCPLIFLDEATTGIDPLARERFWAVLEHLKNTGHTIVFTTFHTAECMALASKLVIIAEGNVQCIGTPQELKQRYARGYCITFRLRHDVLTPIDIVSATMGRVVEFKKSVEQTFVYCDLIDEQDNLLLYFLRDTKISWGDVFRRASDLAEQYLVIVHNYDVTEATVEDLFILLTNKYREMDNPRRTEPGNEFDVSKEEAELKALEQAAQALHMRI